MATSHPLLLDPGYALLKQHLIESTGLAYYADKDADLAARIETRLSQLAIKSCGAYLDLLKNRDAGEAERHLLIGLLTIGETYFFRHTEQFDALRDVVFPDLVERNRKSRTLRIWSAGCAIGAEPYSLAILLKQYFGDRIAGWDIRILGTDINQAFLTRAARGEFDERALRTTPDEIKRIWFSPSGASWTVKPFIKNWVSFQYHNLVEHPYPSVIHGIAALDLILCRNVMIYFEWPVIERILGRFHECLVDGGWLAVGHAESNPDVFRAYRTVPVPGATLYQKTCDLVPAAQYTFSGTKQPEFAFDRQWSPPVLPAVPVFARVDADERRPTPAPTPVARIRTLADQGHWADAARECEQLLRDDQLNAPIHFYQAVIAEQTGQLADAERAFRRALYLDRSFVLAHYHLALLLAKMGRVDNAQQSMRNAQGLLARMDRNQLIESADGLTADDLGQLVAMHLDLWRK